MGRVKGPRTSAGIVLHRRSGDAVEVLLGHMGGPFWAKRDARAWTIPKGEVGSDADPWAEACREFAEELGHPLPGVETGAAEVLVIDLGEIRQAGGKVVRAWAVEGDLDPATVVSNTFELEWPPRSGQLQAFPEIDRAAWFSLDAARAKVVAGQVELLERLANHLAE